MGDKRSSEANGFFLLGLMLGGAVGAAVGLLYAPRPGSDVRRDLADRSADAVDKARHHLGEAPETEPGHVAGAAGGPL